VIHWRTAEADWSRRMARSIEGLTLNQFGRSMIDVSGSDAVIADKNSANYAIITSTFRQSSGQ
jgi:hypothetical protein